MHSDFKELLAAFDARGVPYLVAGGYAIMEYTEPRYTKDLRAQDRVDARSLAAPFGQRTAARWPRRPRG